MIVTISFNIVISIAFYRFYEPEETHDLPALIDQEKLVSYCTYLHTSVEVVFNVVLIAFLIT